MKYYYLLEITCINEDSHSEEIHSFNIDTMTNVIRQINAFKPKRNYVPIEYNIRRLVVLDIWKLQQHYTRLFKVN